MMLTRKTEFSRALENGVLMGLFSLSHCTKSRFLSVFAPHVQFLRMDADASGAASVLNPPDAGERRRCVSGDGSWEGEGTKCNSNHVMLPAEMS